MSDPDQDEIRRKRLARLSQAGAGAGMQGEKSKPAKSPSAESPTEGGASGGSADAVKSPVSETGSASVCSTPGTDATPSSDLPGPARMRTPGAMKSPTLDVPGPGRLREKDSPDAMEVGSLKSGASQVSLDFDSGIENMDVDDKKESPTKRNRTTSSANYEATEPQIRSSIQNILNVTLPGTDGSATAASLSSPTASQMLEAGEIQADATLISIILADLTAQLVANLSPEKVLKHLIACYARSCSEESSMGRRATVPPLSDIIQSTRCQVVSHICLVLEGGWQNEVFTSTSPLYSALCSEDTPSSLLPHLIDSISTDPERLSAVFSPLLQHCYREMSKLRLVDDKHSQPVLILRQLCEIRLASGNRPICDLLVNQPQWLPAEVGTAAGGLEVARLSFLGPFLAPSVFPEEDAGVADRYFKEKMSSTQLKTTGKELQDQLDFLRSQLHTVFHAVLANSSTREHGLALIAEILSRNQKRKQMQANERLNAGDGFMVSLMSVMQLLSSKVRMDKVDPNYIHSQRSRLDLTDESRLKATSQDATEYSQQLADNGAPKEPNFPTECWFLTLQSHHIGIHPIIRRYQRRLRHLREIQKLVEDLEKSEPAWKNHPTAATRNRALIKKWKQQIKKQSKSKACADIGLLDDQLFARCMSFYSSAAEHMLRLIDPVTPRQPRLPLPAEPSQLFSLLPEWLVDDMADFLLFGVQFMPRVVSNNLDDTFLTWLLTILCHPQYFSNPYLVSKLVEVLFVVNPAVQEKTTEVYTRIMSHPICEEFLPSALMRFYTDVEQTGSSNEFYDKFTIRYHISIIIKSMWESAVHKIAIISESNNGKQFIRFINMIMNDTTFLLDESLSALNRIHEVQEDMGDPTRWAAQNQETQSSRHRQLSQDERQCRSYLTLARETVDMFHYLTEGVQEPFMKPELADRLAAMLDAVLEQLTNGPKCKNLKVKNPEKYGWEPKWLLSHIIDIYLHLDGDKMARAMANDERSFKLETFQDAVRRMEGTLNRSQADVQKFSNLYEKANQLVIERLRQEEEWENVPEEFEDAIMGEIMEDPVILPGSGKICDRKHIIRHLLSTPNDPFNRQPLTEDKLVPATDLRQRIKQWKEQQRGRNASTK